MEVRSIEAVDELLPRWRHGPSSVQPHSDSEDFLARLAVGRRPRLLLLAQGQGKQMAERPGT